MNWHFSTLSYKNTMNVSKYSLNYYKLSREIILRRELKSFYRYIRKNNKAQNLSLKTDR
jgi:hypothetical protein